MKSFGHKIRMLRHQHSWSQEQMARQLDISIPAFSKIETGVTDVSLSRMEQIASLFDISIVKLLAYDEIMDTPARQAELAGLLEKLRERENEVMNLQRKVIQLFEALKKESQVPA